MTRDTKTPAKRTTTKRRAHASNPTIALTTFGELLKAWREDRRATQEELGFRANLSCKHISFLETDRTQPSKAVILAIGSALDIPLREVNVLFAAAGIAAPYSDSGSVGPALTPVWQALEHILEKHLPFPAWVVNGKYEVVTLNASALALSEVIAAELPDFPAVDPMFHPLGLRRCIANWEDVATSMLRRIQRDILTGNRILLETFNRIVAYPGIPSDWRHRTLSLTIEPTIAVQMHLQGHRLSFVTALTTFGTATDPSVQELTIESCFPSDTATAEFCRLLPLPLANQSGSVAAGD